MTRRYFAHDVAKYLVTDRDYRADFVALRHRVGPWRVYQLACGSPLT